MPSPLAEGFPVPLAPGTFQALRTLLHEHTGISLAPHKAPMIQSRLAKRLRALGLRDYDAYLAVLRGNPDGEEWTLFINALTTNLTSFFREGHHFSRLVAWVREERPGTAPLRLWSAGCSTGEEPYTLAMTLRRAFPERSVRILATDLDSSVLARAQAGIYPLDRLKDLDEGWRQFAFLRGKGGMEGQARVRPELQDLVTFRPMNLLGESWPGEGRFDVIFCRNTMIYFEKATQRRIIRRFRGCLGQGGLLVVGHSEALLDATLGFASLGETIYQRKEA